MVGKSISHLRQQWIGAWALFLALCGGTAWALQANTGQKHNDPLLTAPPSTAFLAISDAARLARTDVGALHLLVHDVLVKSPGPSMSPAATTIFRPSGGP
jgi:hypothetical protein